MTMTSIGFLIFTTCAVWLFVRSRGFVVYVRDLPDLDVLFLLTAFLGVFLMILGVALKLWGFMP